MRQIVTRQNVAVTGVKIGSINKIPRLRRNKYGYLEVITIFLKIIDAYLKNHSYNSVINFVVDS